MVILPIKTRIVKPPKDDVLSVILKAIQKISETHREDFARISEVSSFIQNLGMVVPEDKKNIIAKVVSELNEIQKKFE